MTGASLGYSGYYVNASLYKVGVYGLWYSATIGSDTMSYFLRIDTDNLIGPQSNNGARYVGRAVRCRNTE